MKTIQQMAEVFTSKAVDGRDSSRLVRFIPEAMLPAFGMTLKEEYVGKHQHEEMTREAVLAQLKKDLAFAFEKALDQRGLSAMAMYNVIEMWLLVLEDSGIDSYELGYAQYGLPLFKAVALKYGFPNPIGADAGNESKYASA